ncbi:spore germination protein [Paenibacillus chartarius]|uniref:Spore germination protein n=1 Tax=Paenibacillus chartarius TaxID=747481 RepID=A0ABV6DIB3_9BACL
MDVKWFLKKTNVNMSNSTNDSNRLSNDLNANVNRIKDEFSYPQNKALIVRDVFIPFIGREGTILFLEGAADTKTLEEHILEPIMAQTGITPEPAPDGILSELMKRILSTAGGQKASLFDEIIRDLLKGNTIICIQGHSEALSIETPGFESRAISEPTNENVLKGPKESFIESAAANRSLIRKQIKDVRLMTEVVNIGDKSLREVSILYLKEVADPALVEKIKDKLRQTNSDLVQSISLLEQFIEERQYSLLPASLLTERPDRACSFLHEGHVVLLMDNSPLAMVLPVTFWALFHTSEDMHLRWAYGIFIRVIRIMAVFVALMTPSLYLAVSTYHEEMLPTDLLLAIASTRERVPFPAFLEVMIMEVTFELVREAGIRIPRAIGPTIGIVGALILGQAAVEANIISPILVIIVAMTGLSSFAIPEISFNFVVRIMRFFMLLSANFMGFYGIALTLTCVIAYMASFESYGVPFLSPLSPHFRSSKDLIIRPPIRKQWLRPQNMNPQDPERSQKPKGNS